MKSKCKIEIDLKTNKNAKKLLKSVKVDDYSFVESKIKDSSLVATVEADSIESLLHTVDDYLSCVSVAEKILDKNNK